MSGQTFCGQSGQCLAGLSHGIGVLVADMPMWCAGSIAMVATFPELAKA